MTHECIIGLYNDYENTRLVNFEELVRASTQINELYNYGSNKNYMEKPTALQDHFDTRKATELTRFAYCPLCGKKISWKEMREKVNGQQ